MLKLFEVAYTFAMLRFVIPGVLESARCRKRGCEGCTWLVPCSEGLRRMFTKLPRARVLGSFNRGPGHADVGRQSHETTSWDRCRSGQNVKEH